MHSWFSWPHWSPGSCLLFLACCCSGDHLQMDTTNCTLSLTCLIYLLPPCGSQTPEDLLSVHASETWTYPLKMEIDMSRSIHLLSSWSWETGIYIASQKMVMFKIYVTVMLDSLQRPAGHHTTFLSLIHHALLPFPCSCSLHGIPH